MLQIAVQFVFATALALLIPTVSYLLGQRGHSQKTKDTPYECGIQTTPGDIGPFPLWFYKAALLFILIDITLAFLIPWAMSFKAAAAAGHNLLASGIIFIGLLTLGVAYQVKNKVLDWKE